MLTSSGLQAKQLGLQIDGKIILADINIELQRGKVLAVIGPNGAGKTSLLKLLSGQSPSHHLVSWCGKTLSDYPPQAMAQQIAVVNQLNEAVFALNLQQIVRMGLLPHKALFSRQTPEDELQIIDAIERVGLTSHSLQTFSSLSGGEQQRGLIARALVQQAALIVLDEPVNHLDVYYQHQILSLLKTLAHQHHITIVMSLHDLNLAANYCDHICLLDKGVMLAQGSPKAVLRSELLQQVFHLPTQVRQDEISGALRVDFYPPQNITSSQHKMTIL
ncbi:ABC transporter ATP-binding protein [Paraglaciecola sp.]|uniref:ABC transporter ATP-binding protein n=1 Tax=Paraglaciecola sp. TaxID=1920173 RepID=UPI0030F3D487